MPPPPKADPAKAPAKPEPAPEPAATAGAARAGGFKAWIPAIAALLLAPVATWATVEFVVLPRLQKKLANGAPVEAAAAETGEHGGGHGEKGKEGKGKEGNSFEFQNQVVNLSGTMGTRYLKTNVHIVGTDPTLKATFEGAKAKLTDVTQSVLSSLTLADLEEPGAKNVIRAKLVLAYNQALNKKVVEEVYLTDFVLQ
jgi:flagellar FliL protein